MKPPLISRMAQIWISTFSIFTDHFKFTQQFLGFGMIPHYGKL